MSSRDTRWRPIARRESRSAARHLFSSLVLLLASVQYSTAQQSALQLTLDQAIDLALKQNRSVHQRALAVEDMRTKKDEARSNYMPQLKATGSLLHLTDLLNLQIPAGAFGKPPAAGPIPSQTVLIGQGSLTTYTGGVGLDQPLTQLFRIHQANVAAGQDVLTAKTQLEETRDEVALQTRQLYYGILINQQQLEAARQQLAAAQVKETEAQNDVERGNALEIAAVQSKASVLDVQQKSLALRLKGDDLARQFANLLGLPVDTQINLDSNLPDKTIDIPTRAEAVHLALEENQDLRIARQTLEKAKAQLAATKDAYIPDITGLTRYSYQSGVAFLVHNFGTFGLSLSYDLFDGGRREAQVRDARTKVQSAQVAVDNLESQVTVQVQTVYDRVEDVKDMVEVAEQMVKVRTEAARLADRQLEQNAALESISDQAHADLSNASASLLEARLNLSLAEADVKRTIGRMPN